MCVCEHSVGVGVKLDKTRGRQAARRDIDFDIEAKFGRRPS